MSESVRTLLTGATGTLGSALRPQLYNAGHDVRAASRSPPAVNEGARELKREHGREREGERKRELEWVPVDVHDGTGLTAAVDGVDVVVHAATAPRGDSEAVDVRGTERLLDAASAAGVSNVVYVSIVGVDEIPYSYYEHKLAAEHLVEQHDVPSTIVRITQFHEFISELLASVARLPVWLLPAGFRVQPIAVDEAAAAVAGLATTDANGRVPPVGGPEVHTVGDLARVYRAHRSLRRPIVPVPIPGRIARGFRSGAATCPERTIGTASWTKWLATRAEASQREDNTGDADASAE
ncbi:SDR family oxidoreductase [Natrialba sp. SSL1]|uniref:SDR family oxidoreductase n=1 Tax=Natrialba sp. SSL1 TaxID=1869245 RepID=UPI0008F934EA|nr:NAD(P)H-binding protein [Natrialba sp. SSL1]OIB58422.1 epimerase [Natrialba sp. SSL1]